MLFRRTPKDPASLLAVLRSQNELNQRQQMGTMNMPKHAQAKRDLAQLGSDAVPALIAALERPRADMYTPEGSIDVAVADDVAEVLGAIGDPRAMAPLLAAGQDLVVGAYRALAAFPEGLAALELALQDPAEGLRAGAIQALGSSRLPRDRRVHLVIQMLKDSSAWVRQSAAQTALANDLSDPPLRALLERLSRDDPEQHVRKMATNACVRLGVAIR